MKSRIPLILLALSLAFNAFVVVGFVRGRGAPTPPPPPAAGGESVDAVVRRTSRDLKLDEKQSKVLADLYTRHHEQAGVFDDSLSFIRQDMGAELAKESPDLDRLRALAGQEADLLRQRRLAGAELYHSFVDVLTPQQRKILGGRVGRGPGPGPGPGGPDGPRGEGREPGETGEPGGMRGSRSWLPPAEMLRRFDANHNGKLDPDEAEAARKNLEKRRGEFFRRDEGRGGPMSQPNVNPEEHAEFGPPHDGPGRDGPERSGPPRGPGQRQAGAMPLPPEVMESIGPGSMIPIWRWFDIDHDGRLSDDEQAQLREFIASHEMPKPPRPAEP